MVQISQATQESCPWCGHVRCDKCLPDRWPNLADGCCECRRWWWLGCQRAK